MQQLYFVRHALSERNMAGLWAGTTDTTPLAPEGVAQAQAAAEAAIGLHIDYIVSSPYSRAYDTAKIIAQRLGYPIEKIEQYQLLTERDFGELEGMPYIAGIDFNTVPKAETTEALLRRACEALQHLRTIPNANTILVVSHGSIGRALRSLINGVPFDQQPKLEHGQIVRFL